MSDVNNVLIAKLLKYLTKCAACTAAMSNKYHVHDLQIIPLFMGISNSEAVRCI